MLRLTFIICLYTKQYLLNLEYEKNKSIQDKKESDQYLNILTKIFCWLYIDNNVELLISNKQCEFFVFQKSFKYIT